MENGQTRLTGFSELDQIIVNSADRFLTDGVALKRWWEEAEATNTYADVFDLVHTFRRSERTKGFFGKVPLEGRTLPVMGVLDEVFYDRPKAEKDHRAAAALWMRDQIREFVLHYFMRVSNFRLPQESVAPDEGTVPGYLSALDMHPKEEIHRKGMGFNQVFYKLMDTGEIGKFPDNESSEIIDLREIGTTYAWLIVKLRVFDFTVTMKPFGADSLQMSMPMKEEGYLILTPEFILNEDNPEPGVLGRYGFGYAFIKNPTRGMFAYGPGEFETAFQTINFQVAEDGATTVRMAFVSDQPEKIMNLNLVDLGLSLADRLSFGMTSKLMPVAKALAAKSGSVDPTLVSISMLNQLTNGMAAKQLAISQEQLFKGFLVKHSLQHYQTLLGSLRTWRQIPDWLDAAALPKWVTEGQSS